MMSRDPLWMEGDDFANDIYSESSDSFDELDVIESEGEDDDGTDPDAWHDAQFED